MASRRESMKCILTHAYEMHRWISKATFVSTIEYILASNTLWSCYYEENYYEEKTSFTPIRINKNAEMLLSLWSTWKVDLCPHSSARHGDTVRQLPSLDPATLCWEAGPGEWSHFQHWLQRPSVFIQSLIIDHSAPEARQAVPWLAQPSHCTALSCL